MCGRYSITTAPEALRHLFDVETALNLEPRHNLAPTQPAPVVRMGERREGDGYGHRPGATQREMAMLQWGLVPSWAKEVSIGSKMINARAETVAEKPAFRAAFRRRRCLIPADGFYEWRTEAGGKQPYRIVRRDRAPFAFAGLWEVWEGRGEGSWLETFTIVTTEANAAIRHIHHRMPVMLFDKGAFSTWLTGETKDAAGLMTACDPGVIEAYPVDKRVGNVRNDDPSLFEPVEPKSSPAPSTPPPPSQGSLF
jgi:putative SOS response-associated peptidase YedK